MWISMTGTVLLVVKIKEVGFSHREKVGILEIISILSNIITWIPTQRLGSMLFILEIELGVTICGDQM